MARVWKRKDRNCWVADFRDSHGRRRRLVAKTREEAENLLANEIAKARRAAPISENPHVRLDEYAEQWLEDIREDLQPKTYRSYDNLLRQHILPALGHIEVGRLTRSHVKKVLEAKRREGYIRGGRKRAFSKNTLRLMNAALSSLLAEAIDDGLLETNPCMQQGRGRRKRPGSMTKADRQMMIRPMSWEQREVFIQTIRGTRHGVLYDTMVKTGVRPSEAFALKPEDVDLRGQTLRVERALTEGGRLKSTKTEEVRDVDLSADMTRLLAQYLPWLKEECLLYGWGEPKWLFPSEVGGPLEESRVRKNFKLMLKRAGLPRFRLYDLRHCYASLLLASGAPITYVSNQLGHASPDTTLRYYAQWIPGTGRRYVDVLDGDGEKVGTKSWHQTEVEEIPSLQVVENAGAGEKIRTSDLLITNQPNKGHKGTRKSVIPFKFRKTG